MADSPREFLLEMTDISKSFPGVKALDNVNLRVRPHSIHALMGENGAGKSTLLKCLFGIYKKDAGSIIFQGQEIDFKSSKEALEHGVSMVHQELNLVLQRTVMDNMWLGRYPTKGMFVDQDKMLKDTQAIFDELDIDINPRDKVGTLSVSQMQMIEIAKAFSYDAKIVIMDEPTSSLTEKEVNHLFTIIRKLKERGCGIVYISHKMEEIFQLCDEITILRDGQWIATQPLEGLDMDKIISMMVGRFAQPAFPRSAEYAGRGDPGGEGPDLITPAFDSRYFLRSASGGDPRHCRAGGRQAHRHPGDAVRHPRKSGGHHQAARQGDQ